MQNLDALIARLVDDITAAVRAAALDALLSAVTPDARVAPLRAPVAAPAPAPPKRAAARPQARKAVTRVPAKAPAPAVPAKRAARPQAPPARTRAATAQSRAAARASEAHAHGDITDPESLLAVTHQGAASSRNDAAPVPEEPAPSSVARPSSRPTPTPVLRENEALVRSTTAGVVIRRRARA